MRKILSYLQRPSSTNSIITEVEGLRFIAIAGVLLMHMGTQILRVNPAIVTQGDWAYLLTKDGGLGVNLFFSISGFILGYPFAKHYLFGTPITPLKKFYFKRLTRLEPPFIINISLVLLMLLFINHQSFRQLMPHYFATLIYSHNFIYGAWSTINPVTWSLETEIQFYLLAPFIFMFLYKIKSNSSRFILLIALLILFIFSHVGTYETFKKYHISRTILSYFDSFLAGIIFLDIYLNKNIWEKINKSYLWDVAAMIALVAFFSAPNFPTFLSGIIMAVSTIVLFIAAFKGKVANLFFTNKLITVIGGMCYTIYLYHYAIFTFLSKYAGKILPANKTFATQFLIQGSIMCLIVLTFCGFLFYFFEKPFMVRNWYKKK